MAESITTTIRKCSSCPNPAREGKSRCQKCAQRDLDYAERRKQDLRERGLCLNCGKTPPKSRCKYCPACLDKINRKHAKRAETLEGEGRCRYCSTKCDRKGSVCVNCTHKQREQRKGRQLARREQGRCVTCGEGDADHPFKRCAPCRKATRGKRRELWQQRIEAGLCTRCGAAPHKQGAQMCAPCADYQMTPRRRLKEAIISAYGGKCACCGEADSRFLTVDHVQNDGAEERRQIGHWNILANIRRQGFPDRYQLLCYNCNCAKGVYGSCPHSWPA
jgi:hypothetical protein